MDWTGIHFGSVHLATHDEGLVQTQSPWSASSERPANSVVASQRLRAERRTDAEDLDRFSVALVREILDEVLVLKEPLPAATIGSDGRGLVCALSVIHHGFAFGPAHGAELWQRNSSS